MGKDGEGGEDMVISALRILQAACRDAPPGAPGEGTQGEEPEQLEVLRADLPFLQGVGRLALLGGELVRGEVGRLLCYMLLPRVVQASPSSPSPNPNAHPKPQPE